MYNQNITPAAEQRKTKIPECDVLISCNGKPYINKASDIRVYSVVKSEIPELYIGIKNWLWCLKLRNGYDLAHSEAIRISKKEADTVSVFQNVLIPDDYRIVRRAFSLFVHFKTIGHKVLNNNKRNLSIYRLIEVVVPSTVNLYGITKHLKPCPTPKCTAALVSLAAKLNPEIISRLNKSVKEPHIHASDILRLIKHKARAFR